MVRCALGIAARHGENMPFQGNMVVQHSWVHTRDAAHHGGKMPFQGNMIVARSVALQKGSNLGGWHHGMSSRAALC